MNKTVFVTYKHCKLNIVNDIEVILKDLGFSIIKDKQHLKYNQNINLFKIQGITNSNFILGFICNEYLKSKNCMDEILKIMKHRTLESCFIPIVHYETNIYFSNDRFKKQKFWLEEMLNLQSMIREFPLKFRSENLKKELQLVTEINANFGYFIEFLLSRKHLVWTKNKRENLNNLVVLADELNKVILFKIKTINWEKLEKQLSEDDLEGILNILINKNKSQSREEAILILGRLSALDKEKRLGIIDDKDATIERNKIRISILNFMKFLKAKEN